MPNVPLEIPHCQTSFAAWRVRFDTRGTKGDIMTTIHAPATTGERLTRARLWVGLDQSEMAALLGRTRQTVSNWERDAVEPPFSAVAQWAKITRRSLDWIAFGEHEEEAPSEDGASVPSRPRESNPRPFHYE